MVESGYFYMQNLAYLHKTLSHSHVEVIGVETRIAHGQYWQIWQNLVFEASSSVLLNPKPANPTPLRSWEAGLQAAVVIWNGVLHCVDSRIFSITMNI